MIILKSLVEQEINYKFYKKAMQFVYYSNIIIFHV